MHTNLNAVAMPTTIANTVFFFWFRDVEVCKLLCLVNRLLVSYISSVLISFGFAHTSVDLFDFNKINSVTGAYEKPCETHEQFNLFKQLFCSRRCSFFCVCCWCCCLWSGIQHTSTSACTPDTVLELNGIYRHLRPKWRRNANYARVECNKSFWAWRFVTWARARTPNTDHVYYASQKKNWVREWWSNSLICKFWFGALESRRNRTNEKI